MSTFKEEITLTNAADRSKAADGLIPKANIRTVTVDAYVDTAAWTLVITEKVRAALGLEGSRVSTLADGTQSAYSKTEPVHYCWKDREYAMPALVVPTANEVLFGALPMESLDVYADPVDECLKGRHGDKPLHILF